MRLSFTTIVLALSGTCLCTDYLVGVPTVPFKTASKNVFSLQDVKTIVVDPKYTDATDTNGETLIPPTLRQFAQTFADDLRPYLSHQEVDVATHCADSGQIHLTLGDPKDFLDAAGRPTSEGYTLSVTQSGITITGASPLGVWWGTRTVLQQATLNEGKLPLGSGTDAPGWGTRGVMLDAGRHYYPPGFLKEMCSYLSFFKQNTFHVHISDNLINSASYTREESLELYAAFRPNSPDPAVAGLNKRPNESYYQSDFEDVQRSCASRGVTIIPELEMPGHALVISQWKPELGMSTDISLLNISNPDTIPTAQTIWKTFLPWFHSKTVHIGADEYFDSSLTRSALAALYNTFANAMNDFITSTSSKSMRIWGTFPPMDNYTNNINTSVSIQHWDFSDGNPLFQYIKNGYSVVNSDDRFYIVNKYSGGFPQTLNLTRIFHGSPDGSAFAPNIFDLTNATNNPPRSEPLVQGHIAALWNDYGPNTSVYTEAYYAWRNDLPALGDKQWGGNLMEEEYSQVFDKLHAAVPGQNLDRAIPSKSSTILEYSSFQGQHIKDTSGNGYDGKSNCKVSQGAAVLTPDCAVTTPLGSKGRNYTLSFSIYPTGKEPGALFTGPDSTLLAGNGSISNIMLVASGNPYVLNYSLPLNEWTQASLIGRGNKTYFGLGNGTEMEFLARIGLNGRSLVWREIAVEAPLAKIGGDGFSGSIKNVKLVDFA